MVNLSQKAKLDHSGDLIFQDLLLKFTCYNVNDLPLFMVCGHMMFCIS